MDRKEIKSIIPDEPMMPEITENETKPSPPSAGAAEVKDKSKGLRVTAAVLAAVLAAGGVLAVLGINNIGPLGGVFSTGKSVSQTVTEELSPEDQKKTGQRQRRADLFRSVEVLRRACPAGHDR